MSKDAARTVELQVRVLGMSCDVPSASSLPGHVSMKRYNSRHTACERDDHTGSWLLPTLHGGL